MVEEEKMRRGPWTEQEDAQLVLYVNLFGDRRWDFVAKVSGLKRTGKSCRLRWVNYLHPGLKRGKLTPHEENLVLQLHSKLGNRWSKIARKLPGRTDNEIKNYWRTYMRKKLAQEKKKRRISPPTYVSTSSSSSSSSGSNNSSMEALSSSISQISFPTDSIPFVSTKEMSLYDTGGKTEMILIPNGNKDDGKGEENEKVYSMDDIWREIAESEEKINSFCPKMDSPIWNYCPDMLWMMEEDESENLPVITDQIFGFCDESVSSGLIG